MTDLLLQRRYKNGDAVIGELYLDGQHQCWTLERTTVIIPSGQYAVEQTYSPRFGTLMPLLDGVPDRTGIRIHWGNFPTDTDGCLLVGEAHGETYLNNSKAAYESLVAQLKYPCSITITENY